MSCMAWNNFGLGDLQTVRCLFKIKRRERPKIVFLSETILNSDNVDMLRKQCNFNHAFKVDTVGRSDNLILIWKEEVEVSIIGFSKYHFEYNVQDTHGKKWRLTRFYKEPITQQRHLA